MKHIKRIEAVILCVALCLVLMPKIARAATMEVTLSQDTFLTADTVTVTLNITNDSQYPMTQLNLSAGGRSYDCGSATIEPGAKQPITIDGFLVGEAFIGRDLDFILTWMENGESKSTTTTVHINDAEAPDFTIAPTLAPEELIEFSCYSDNPRAEKGEKVEITYKVVNNSSINMTDITITDKEISDAPVVSGGKVAANDTGYFTYDYEMGIENVDTAPIMSYALAGEMKSLRGNAITLESVTVDMDVSIVRRDPTSQGTEFVIRMANNGNNTISDLRVYKGEEKIEHAFDLHMGEEREISYFENPTGKSTLSFKITGTLATGEEYLYTSDTYTVWQYIDPSTVGMEFSLNVAEPIDKEGYVSIDFTAKNAGTVDMTGITVEEEKMGKVGTFSNLAGGGEETISLTLYVGEARDMNFTLTAIAPTGQPYEYTQKISSQKVSIGNGDALPSGLGASSIDVGGAASKVFKKILIVFGVLSGVFGVGLIVLAVFEHQQNLGLKKKKELS